jgi:hypothetical protein
VVADAREEGPFQGLQDGWDELGRKRQLFFSADGRRLAYGARRSGRWFAVVDGTPGEPHDEVGRPVFSPNGDRVCYRAKRGKNWFVVVDGMSGRPADEVRSGAMSQLGQPREEVTFSPDGRHVAYRAKTRGKWSAVVDSKEGRAYDDIGSLSWSPDGQHMAYAAKRDGRWLLVIDEVEHGEHDFVSDLIPGLGVLSRALEDRRVVFDGPLKLHAMIKRAGQALRLDAELK